MELDAKLRERSSGIYKYLPYSENRDVRKQVEDLFSREVLGAVIVGKYTGDYAAILVIRYLGTDLGYITGIIFSILFFIYWDIIVKKAEKTKEEAKEKAKRKKEAEEFV